MSSSNKYVVIHAHFYQPSREDPWLFQIPQEEGAYPYHDWNERITEECYRPNALIPIIDSEGRVIDVINNYSWISFNVGPTLLKWFQEKALTSTKRLWKPITSAGVGSQAMDLLSRKSTTT